MSAVEHLIDPSTITRVPGAEAFRPRAAATARAKPQPRRRGPLLGGEAVEALKAASGDPFLKGESILAALHGTGLGKP